MYVPEYQTLTGFSVYTIGNISSVCLNYSFNQHTKPGNI